MRPTRQNFSQALLPLLTITLIVFVSGCAAAAQSPPPEALDRMSAKELQELMLWASNQNQSIIPEWAHELLTPGGVVTALGGFGVWLTKYGPQIIDKGFARVQVLDERVRGVRRDVNRQEDDIEKIGMQAHWHGNCLAVLSEHTGAAMPPRPIPHPKPEKKEEESDNPKA